MKVKECMSKNVLYCNPNATVLDVAQLMNQNQIGCIPVCNTENNVIGILTDRDITLRSVACGKDAKKTNVSEIMTTKASCCDYNDEISTIAETMGKTGIRRMPVTMNGKLVGILTTGDLAKHENITPEYIGLTLESICNCNKKNN